MGTYSVGGGPKKHTSLRESKGSSIKRGPSYREPSTTKTSSGIAQAKTTPIKGTPKQSVAPSLSSTTSVPTTTTSKKTTTTTAPKTIGERGAEALKRPSNAARLKEIMDSMNKK